MVDTELVSFPIVVSGPSGVGKTTLCHGLMEKVPHLAFSISATTRPAREIEKHGRDYFFVSTEEFKRMQERNELAEWAHVHGEMYGTPKSWLDEQLTQGTSILLDIDVQGGVQIMEAYPKAVSIFVIPPTFQVLEARLRGRKTDSEEAMRGRLETALKEMEYVMEYSYVVANDTIAEAVSRMEHIVRAERLKRERIIKGSSWKELYEPEGKGV